MVCVGCYCNWHSSVQNMTVKRPLDSRIIILSLSLCYHLKRSFFYAFCLSSCNPSLAMVCAGCYCNWHSSVQDMTVNGPLDSWNRIVSLSLCYHLKRLIRYAFCQPKLAGQSLLRLSICTGLLLNHLFTPTHKWLAWKQYIPNQSWGSNRHL